MTTALAWTKLEQLQGFKKCANQQYVALCPSHSDRKPSLSISLADDGRVLIHCHAGCATDDIIRSLGITPRDLYPQPNGDGHFPDRAERRRAERKLGKRQNAAASGRARTIADVYIYKDSTGNEVCRKIRTEPKGFYWELPDGTENLDGVIPPLYRMNECIRAPYIFFVEGERDVNALHARRFPVTCNPHGAGEKWKSSYNQSFHGKKVFIIPDNDPAGENHALNIARNLLGIAKEVKILRLDGLLPGGDVSDWLLNGGTDQELKELARTAPPFTEADLNKAALFGNSLNSLNSLLVQYPDPPSKDVYFGLPGRIVNHLAPQSESDPIAILIQLMTLYGNLIGSRPHLKVEDDIHRLNIYLVLVGNTAKARKGTSFNRARTLFSEVDPSYIASNIRSGLSTGEGLIAVVRDSTDKCPGVSDKRALIMEPEFARVLRVASREGNTLTMVVRELWDSGNAETITKNNPQRTTDAHVSIIGHITRDELIRYLNRTEMANGFANRFLWFCVARSKLLPYGGSIPGSLRRQFSRELKEAVQFASGVDEIQLSKESRPVWEEIYTQLSEGKPGLLGAITARSEPQVLRLAALYALLSKSKGIAPEHLKAAYSLWQYSDASCRFIFGDSLGDPVADAILSVLRGSAKGLTKSEIIKNVFQGNRSVADIDRALLTLAQCGLARSVTQQSTGTKNIEKWIKV
jgi:hypothetical protein